MTEELKNTIKEQLAELPNEGQAAIASVDWVKIAEEIGLKNGLNQEEISDLQLETLLVLIGAVDPQFYATNIENHVETTKEKAEVLAEEVLQKIFIPIRTILEENLKNKIKNRLPDWHQTVDFILSGGDYGAFVETRN